MRLSLVRRLRAGQAAHGHPGACSRGRTPCGRSLLAHCCMLGSQSGFDPRSGFPFLSRQQPVPNPNQARPRLQAPLRQTEGGCLQTPALLFTLKAVGAGGISKRGASAEEPGTEPSFPTAAASACKFSLEPYGCRERRGFGLLCTRGWSRAGRGLRYGAGIGTRGPVLLPKIATEGAGGSLTRHEPAGRCAWQSAAGSPRINIAPIVCRSLFGQVVSPPRQGWLLFPHNPQLQFCSPRLKAGSQAGSFIFFFLLFWLGGEEQAPKSPLAPHGLG